MRSANWIVYVNGEFEGRGETKVRSQYGREQGWNIPEIAVREDRAIWHRSERIMPVARSNARNGFQLQSEEATAAKQKSVLDRAMAMRWKVAGKELEGKVEVDDERRDLEEVGDIDKRSRIRVRVAGRVNRKVCLSETENWPGVNVQGRITISSRRRRRRFYTDAIVSQQVQVLQTEETSSLETSTSILYTFSKWERTN